ncbi:MAG TPA: hypothetical protein VG755_05855 [Nannocystaceae bacterium]|nr:hypothetical protein [Nannocystaceae bacterium]
MRCAASLALAIVLAACDDGGNSDDGDASSEASGSESGDVMQWMTLDERPCPDDSTLTWESFGGPFVLSYCSTCHGSGLPADMRQNAPVGLDFEHVDQVRMHADRIWARAADQNATMPPAGAPARDDRSLLGEWLACGAPTDADLAE